MRIKVRCEHCGLIPALEYEITAPNLNNPERKLRQYLCLFCAKDLEEAGIKIEKATENGKLV
jgi:DNA-directed RNA polymerase subunit RPC12/RpoP